MALYFGVIVALENAPSSEAHVQTQQESNLTACCAALPATLCSLHSCLLCNMHAQTGYIKPRQNISSPACCNTKGNAFEALTLHMELFDKAWAPTGTFAASLAAIGDDIGPLTGVCIVGQENFDIDRIWEALGLPNLSPHQSHQPYHTVSLLRQPASNLAYLIVSHGVHFTSSRKARRATTLCLAASDVVLIVSRAFSEFNPLNVKGAYETIFNLLHTTALLETELRPTKFIIVDLHPPSQGDRGYLDKAASVLIRQVNESLSEDRRLYLEWSSHAVEYNIYRNQSYIRASEEIRGELRNDIIASTPRFTRAIWGAFMQASWDRITKAEMPSITTAVALFRDRIQNRKTEMLDRIHMTTTLQALYDCSVLREAQDTLEREVAVLPSWIALDPAHSRAAMWRDLVSAAFDAALLHLIDLLKAKFQKDIDDASASTEDVIARWNGMRNELETLRKSHVAAFMEPATDIKLVKYSHGRRLLGLGLTPDAVEQAHLGDVEEDIDRPTPSQLKEGQSKLSNSLSHIIETELEAASQSLLQHINQKMDGLTDSFEKLCAMPEASNLAHGMWALCVSETQSLWKIYGRACKGLLVTPDQLQKCNGVISSFLLSEDATGIEVRHPWDTLLMQVMSRLMSDLDLTVEGVVRFFNLKDKAMRAEDLSPSQAMKKTEALFDALSCFDLVSTRPPSLCVAVLPLLKLEPEEEELLTLPLDSVKEAWEQFASELQTGTTPNTHIDTEDESSVLPVPLADCTWHFASG